MALDGTAYSFLFFSDMDDTPELLDLIILAFLCIYWQMIFISLDLIWQGVGFGKRHENSEALQKLSASS